LRERLYQSVRKAEKEIPAAALARLGGSRLVLQADTDAVRTAMQDGLRTDVRRLMREARVGYGSLVARDVGVEVKMREPSDVPRAMAALAATTGPSGDDVDLHDMGDGVIRLVPTERGVDQRMQRLLQQTAQVVKQRLDTLGVAIAGAEVDEPDRIAVLLPGVTDPAQIVQSLLRRAQLEFRLIDVSIDVDQALRSGAPPDSEVLYGFKTKTPYLVGKHVELGGEELAEAMATIDSRTDQPIISFRFTAHGTSVFAGVTQQNVGRPFAIVLDREVISAPVVREPILNGSGQISGGFTVQEANDLALRMRAGALPLRLTLIEQTAVAATPQNQK
jgi:preprotein translocase subunit SecD